jgi:uncharacterized protein YbjT (DUF2867 family)
MTVLVTGSRGRIAQCLISRLRAAGTPVRTAGTQPGAGEHYLDLVSGEGAEAALDGVDAVFLYSQPAGIRAFVDAATAAGVRHVVQLSSSSSYGPAPDSDPLASKHRIVERALAASELPSTFLQPSEFASNALAWADAIRTRSSVRLPYPDAQVAPIHEDDIAAVAQIVLAERSHIGEGLKLTGPRSLTHRAEVGILAQTLGRPIELFELTHEQAQQQPPSYSTSAEIYDAVLDGYARRVGVPALVTDAVEVVTGAPARSFEEWAVEHRSDYE